MKKNKKIILITFNVCFSLAFIYVLAYGMFTISCLDCFCANGIGSECSTIFDKILGYGILIIYPIIYLVINSIFFKRKDITKKEFIIYLSIFILINICEIIFLNFV